MQGNQEDVQAHFSIRNEHLVRFGVKSVSYQERLQARSLSHKGGNAAKIEEQKQSRNETELAERYICVCGYCILNNGLIWTETDC